MTTMLLTIFSFCFRLLFNEKKFLEIFFLECFTLKPGSEIYRIQFKIGFLKIETPLGV